MRFKQSKTRNGLTLVEVVAALALMGVLMFLATHANQMRIQTMQQAKTRLTAIRAADRLVARWTFDGVIPVAARGSTDVDGLYWETIPSNRKLEILHAQTIRLLVSEKVGGKKNVLVELELVAQKTKQNQQAN